MPIKGLMQRGSGPRLPRLGVIRLGVSVAAVSAKGESYRRGQEVDYFVVPPELAEALGDEHPKALEVSFPFDEIPLFFDPSYIRYDGNFLAVKCDGEQATFVQRKGPEIVKPCVRPARGSCECKAKALGRLNVIVKKSKRMGIYQVLIGGEERIRMLTSELALCQGTLHRVGAKLPQAWFTLEREPTDVQTRKPDGERVLQKGFPVRVRLNYSPGLVLGDMPLQAALPGHIEEEDDDALVEEHGEPEAGQDGRHGDRALTVGAPVPPPAVKATDLGPTAEHSGESPATSGGKAAVEARSPENQDGGKASDATPAEVQHHEDGRPATEPGDVAGVRSVRAEAVDTSQPKPGGTEPPGRGAPPPDPYREVGMDQPHLIGQAVPLPAGETVIDVALGKQPDDSPGEQAPERVGLTTAEASRKLLSDLERVIPGWGEAFHSPQWKELAEQHADAWCDEAIVELLLRMATLVNIGADDYRRYITLKYAHVRGGLDKLPAAMRAEQARMLCRALEDVDFRPKAVEHIRKVGKLPPPEGA